MKATHGIQSVTTTVHRVEKILVMADDFTGACEVSLPWMTNGYDTAISLDPVASRHTTVHVVDTDTRGKNPRTSREMVLKTLASHQDSTMLVKKIDSLWRGNIPAELSALAEAGYTLVVAGALPHLNRVVMNGEPLVAGTPLSMTNAWEIEPTLPPVRIAELFPDFPVSELARPNADKNAWETQFSAALDSGQILIADCRTECDLAQITSFVLDRIKSSHVSGTQIAFVGTGALNAAVAAELKSRRLSSSIGAARQPVIPTGQHTPHPLFAVVGSASGRSGEQLAYARNSGLTVASNTDDVESDLCAGNVAILTAPLELGNREAILSELRLQASSLLAAFPSADLFLTGGETARAILDDQAVDTLLPMLQLEPGVVICQAPDGRLVGTKPGTFGGADVLAHALHTMRALRNAPQENDHMNKTLQDTRPYIAVTMGDGAGVGPEVTVGALIDPRAYATSRPVVIGDTHRMRLGAQALGVGVEIVEIAEVSEAIFTPGRINVIDPHLLSEDLPWGKESAEAGNAAYHYIRIACELGMNGQVQGICTAPLNKAALHSAGHIYPGHTELLAHFMGVDEVSMMLSTPKVKVIHVTTHIGLIDAIAKIEPGLVERTVQRGHEALVRAGNPNPKIGVCAINPHAGENGLFGYGEEEAKIIPALEKLRAAGIDAVGPLPADTAFFLAGRGDYDLIVAMYHDQGHGPVKVLGIEAGVNITVGLPVIRTSVDHGTAFDIAGTGVVEVGSMIEALAQAVNLASVPVI